MWDLPGGHVEPGEDELATLIYRRRPVLPVRLHGFAYQDGPVPGIADVFVNPADGVRGMGHANLIDGRIDGRVGR